MVQEIGECVDGSTQPEDLRHRFNAANRCPLAIALDYEGKHMTDHVSASYAGLWDRLLRRYGGELRHTINRIVARFSRIPTTPVLSPNLFPWADELQERWTEIRDEVAAGLPSDAPSLTDLSPEHKGINADAGWSSVFLWGYGYQISDVCHRFPKTAKLVERIPGLLTAMISVHQPGTRLTPHRGVTKGMLTVHLPLIVPKDGGACRLRVDSHIENWREGKLFVFDDTYDHETWNETDSVRVNLMLHVRRPLRRPGLWLQNFFFWVVRRSAFVRDARGNVEAWARTLTNDPKAVQITDRETETNAV